VRKIQPENRGVISFLRKELMGFGVFVWGVARTGAGGTEETQKHLQRIRLQETREGDRTSGSFGTSDQRAQLKRREATRKQGRETNRKRRSKQQHRRATS